MSAVHLKEQHDEKATVFKGLVALGGVYFFFMAEKILALISEFRAERQQIQVSLFVIRIEATMSLTSHFLWFVFIDYY